MCPRPSPLRGRVAIPMQARREARRWNEIDEKKRRERKKFLMQAQC
jgi:hypothetical protein